MKKPSNLVSLDEAEQQNYEINENLGLLSSLYSYEDLSKGLLSAISETYYLYYRKARDLYVATLNMVLQESNVSEDTMKYSIADDSLTLIVEGVFNEKTAENFLDVEILETVLHLGFIKLKIWNHETNFKIIYFQEDMENLVKIRANQ